MPFGQASDRDSRVHPNTAAVLSAWTANHLDGEIAWEETQELPFSIVFATSRDDFGLYSLKVDHKANAAGKDGVEIFETPYARGVVRYNVPSHVTSVASVQFASKDGIKNVLMTVGCQGPKEELSKRLAPILSSFRFAAADQDPKSQRAVGR